MSDAGECRCARRRTRRAAGGVCVLACAYAAVIRPRAKRWGATDEEVARALPGDAAVPGAGYVATRAITIRARPEHVWPWLVQMGSGRGGWYALDRLDNGGAPSARVVVPELQDLRVGDLVPMVAGKDVGPRVAALEPSRRLLLVTRDEFSWEWVLEPAGADGTRLVNRIRERYPPLLSRRMVYAIVAGLGDVVMNWKQLTGIRERAERLARAEDGGAAVPNRREVLAS